MEFTEFEKNLLTFLKGNNDKECIDLIDNNKKVIQTYLQNSQASSYLKELIDCINNVIIENLKQYELIEKVLKHEEFTDILAKFRESDIVIRACNIENINALNWLLTMNINPGVCDENGMNALMHAAEHQNLLFVVDYYINMRENNKYFQATDNNGENALFHAVDNVDIFSKLLNNSDINVNHKNNNNETVFIYCCRKDKVDAVSKLISNPECDFNCIDNNGRTGLMYLVENRRANLLFVLSKSKQVQNIDVNYRNKNNETLLTILVKQFYDVWQSQHDNKKEERIADLVTIFRSLVNMNCDFNSAIDEEGNTMMNFLLMIDDLPSAFYLIKKYDDLDLSIKNKDGISASFLSLFMIENVMTKLLDFKNLFTCHKTFDYHYLDSNNNNILIHDLVRDNKNYFFKHICNILDNTKVLNQPNNKKENVVIVAVKLGHFDYIKEDMLNKFDLNQQDELGNTALHYAIKLRDDYAINSLCYNHADKDLKNNQGKSPMDLVMEIKDQKEVDDNGIENIEDYNRIVNIMENPIPPNDMKKSSSKSSFKSIFSRKKKTTDKKVNNYVNNYLLEQYKKEYENLLLRPYSPYTSLLKKTDMKWNLYFTYNKSQDHGYYGNGFHGYGDYKFKFEKLN